MDLHLTGLVYKLLADYSSGQEPFYFLNYEQSRKPDMSLHK
jgi:hypothetical protein